MAAILPGCPSCLAAIQSLGVRINKLQATIAESRHVKNQMTMEKEITKLLTSALFQEELPPKRHVHCAPGSPHGKTQEKTDRLALQSPSTAR
jgi:hypothetical protein